MVLINTGGAVHPDEPAYCISKTEVTREVDNAFWTPRMQEQYSESKCQDAVAGPRKPAVFRSWNGARRFCQEVYKSGDLPTARQWEKACGSGEYCTASGTLNHTEAVYDVDGPADVGSKVANSNGLYDMTGNVNEWLRDTTADSYYSRYVTGGSWGYGDNDGDLVFLRAAFRNRATPYYEGQDYGFRCVALPEDSSK